MTAPRVYTGTASDHNDLKPGTDSGSTASSGAASGLPPRGSARARSAEDAHGKPNASSAPKSKAGKKSKSTWRNTRWGRMLELLAYLVMLVLALVYFTGKGLFIYEGF